MYGTINSEWRVDNDILTYKATVPANTTATLYIQTGSERDVKEDGVLASQVPGITM